MANLTTEMKQLIGLLETAVHNANDSQNRVGSMEPEVAETKAQTDSNAISISDIEDALIEISEMICE